MKSRVRAVLAIFVSIVLAALAAGYTYGMEPKKTVVADEGRQFKRHVRESQAMALRHERTLSSMEYQAKEAEVAKKLGVQPPPASAPTHQSQPHASVDRNWGNGAEPIPWAQAPGTLPAYQPPPFPQQAVGEQVVYVPMAYHPTITRLRYFWTGNPYPRYYGGYDYYPNYGPSYSYSFSAGVGFGGG